MSDRTATPTTPLYELVLERTFDAPPELVYRCWTEPELLTRWFTPAPWSTSHAELDVRPGGSSLVVMKDPEGNEHPNPGVYLEVVPNRKIVFTDAYVNAWTPAENPFFTGVITFEPNGRGTKYTARALHWTKENRDKHEQMGFHEGWGAAAKQLEDVLRTL